MKKVTSIILALFAGIFFTACNDDNDTVMETNTIVDVAVKNNLTSLVAAVQRAGLASTLSGNGSFTVFAPTNDAFQALLDSNPNWNFFRFLNDPF